MQSTHANRSPLPFLSLLLLVVLGLAPAAGAREQLVESLAGTRKFAPLWPGGTFEQGSESGLSWARVVTDGKLVHLAGLNLTRAWTLRGIGSTMLREDPRLAGKFQFLAGVEMFFPTATDDLLGSGKFTISPIFVPMYAGGPNWFIAPMIFPYRTDFAGEGGRADIDLTLCRCFAMYAFDNGMYLLPEMQPIYDWNADEFSLFVMPEVGKILAPGRIAYVKPGFGIDTDPNEREWGVEIGFRYFF